MYNILVTGATGFLGSAVVEALLVSNYRVLAVGRKKNGLISDKSFQNPKFSFLRYDILDKNFINKIKSIDTINTIIHLAAEVPNATDQNLEKYLRGNVLLTQSLLSIANELNVSKFIYSSTGSIFSRKPDNYPINEDSSPYPLNYYALTKFCAEKTIEIEVGKSQLKAVVIRFPIIYGKNNHTSIVDMIYREAVGNSPIELFGEGKFLRNLIYINDAVDVILKSIKFEPKNQFEIMNAGSPNSESIIAIARIIKDLTKSKSKIVKKMKKASSTDWDVVFDISKLESNLNIRPRSIRSGLKSYIKDMND